MICPTRLAVVVVSLCVLGTAQQALVPADVPPEAPPGTELIDRDDLRAHATFLASDDLGGRMTGSPGQEEAARYIAAHFGSLGLEPCGDEQADGTRGWFQEYPVRRTSLDRPELRARGEAITTGFAVLAATVEGDVEADAGLVLVPARGEMPDLRGAVAVAVLKAPKIPVRNVEAVFSSGMTAFGKARGLAKRAAQRGAVAMVFCLLDDEGGVATVLDYVALSPGQDRLAYGTGHDMALMADNWKAPIPQMFVGTAVTNRLAAAFGVDSVDVTDADAGAGRRIDGGITVRVRTDAQARARNVVALWRGQDAGLGAEAVVYSAHMDHVGTRLDGEVFNGADDNASGTSGLLDIAQAYARSPRPRRSIVFLSVSGEELGLWGSQWFSEHPTWERSQIVADVNTDMIGRSGPESAPDEVMVTPSYRHEMFSTIVRDAATIGEQLGVAFTNGDKYYTRSDHFNFARLGIPVVFFCSGEHEDYHQVSDEVDRLDVAKMERIARLAYWVGRQVADADGRPEKLGARRDWSGSTR